MGAIESVPPSRGRVGVILPLRFERDQHDIVFSKVELLLEFSVTADLQGLSFQRRATVFGFDFSDLRLGELRRRTPIAVGVIGVEPFRFQS